MIVIVVAIEIIAIGLKDIILMFTLYITLINLITKTYRYMIVTFTLAYGC